MLIPEGYKQTEVGVIPEDWDIDILESRMCIRTGSRNTEDKVNNGQYPFFVRSQQIEYIDTYNYDCEAVLTAGDGAAGKIFHYINGKFDAHQRVYILSQFYNISALFFYYFFKTNFLDEVKKYTAKSTVDSVRRDMIAKMQVPLPHFSEQTAIAEALSDADALITSLEKLIVKKKHIKQGAMQELLTGKRRLPGFDGEWVEKPLGNLLQYEQPTSYLVRNTEYTQNGLPVLTAGKTFVLGYTKELDGIYNNLPVIIFDDFTAESKYVNFKFKVKSSAMKFLTATGLCDLRLVYALMQLIEFLLKDHKRYWISTYSKLCVSIPVDKAEQTAITTVLSDIDSEIEQLTAKLTKVRLIKQGMMQELLTGRIRLINSNSESVVIQKTKAESIVPQEPVAVSKGHNEQFDDAVAFAAIVDTFYSDKYTLGRVKTYKLLYLMRRRQQAEMTGFKKMAAGPYKSDARYKGGENIAIEKGYIVEKRQGEQGFGFVLSKGKNIAKGLQYAQDWHWQANIQWLLDNFKFSKTKNLEVLATVDMALCELREARKPVTLSAIKDVLRNNKEWMPKLEKDYFNDTSIENAIAKSTSLFD